MDAERVASELMKMAARKSVETGFGWTHPDCVWLQEAARILRGEPVKVPSEQVEGVLSDWEIMRGHVRKFEPPYT